MRVLYVEDDQDCRELTSLFLESSGVAVSTALTCAEALDVLRAERFDLVLADIGLPDRDGWIVARWVREHAPGTRVIVLSGWGRSADARRAREVDAVLEKPVSPPLLLAKMRELCAEPPKEGRSS